MKAQFKKIFIIGMVSINLIAPYATTFGAEEVINLPVISKPQALNEGTQRALTPAQIEELLPWAKDSKIFLQDLLESIQSLTMQDKVERLVDGIKQVVTESSPKYQEMLMRYSLNRGLVLYEIINQETDAQAVGSIDLKYTTLVASINIALKYYETDMKILTAKTSAPYVIFGLDYFDYLSEINKSVLDASAQYQIQRTAFEWLQWDLYRDLNNKAYAAQIVKINNGLKLYPNKKLSDTQSLANIRQIKKLALGLNVKETLNKLDEEAKLKAAKDENERAEIIKEQELKKMRGVRTELQIIKVNSLIESLKASNWLTRNEAARELCPIFGADVSLALLNRYKDETSNELLKCDNRFANANYLLNSDHQEEYFAEASNIIIELVNHTSSLKRYEGVILARKFPSLKMYKNLYQRIKIETDSDIKEALTITLTQMEKSIEK